MITKFQTDFENLDKPMGFFEDYDPQSFTKWVRGNGSTQNKNTGPPFDHTLFNPEGLFWGQLSLQYKAQCGKDVTNYFLANCSRSRCFLVDFNTYYKH